jgi:hypothetical protein
MLGKRNFTDLSLPEQASIVLISILDDIANGKRTIAAVEAHVADLYRILTVAYNVPDQDTNLVVEAVAKAGIEMLPGYPEEMMKGRQPIEEKVDGGK